jgi:hypothetical protein
MRCARKARRHLKFSVCNEKKILLTEDELTTVSFLKFNSPPCLRRHPRYPLTFGTSKPPGAVTRCRRTAHLGIARARRSCAVKFSFEETLVEVYRQLFNDSTAVVKLGDRRYPVRRSRVHHLRQVDFLPRLQRARTCGVKAKKEFV